MKKTRFLLPLIIILLIVVIVMTPLTVAAQSSDEPAVKAVLFYSPTCPHCHTVINEVLVPMLNEHGKQLQIVGIDTSQLGGAQLYQATIERYQVPSERRGVPTLVVGDVVLVGGGEIPAQFPTLFEEGLAAGGIDWPDIPGLAEMLSVTETEPSPTATSPETATPVSTWAATAPATATPLSSPTAMPQATTALLPSPTAVPAPSVLTVGEDEIRPGEAQEPSPDPPGFALAGVVLVGMVAAFGYAAWRVTLARRHLFRLSRNPVARARTWAVPILILLGLGVATYLAYVEVKHVEAICGPVGECNIVQGSDYALLLGVPVAVWGVLNYLAVGVLWTGQRYLPGRWANLSAMGLLGLTLFAVLFSIYLTCLELFVIRAICIWCLSSAVITTMVTLLVVVPATKGEFYADL
jgi:uncharacterized membrane protein/glutaredoxin